MSLFRQKMKAEPLYYVMSGASTLFDSIMFVVITVFYYTVVGLNPLQLVLVGTVLEGSILLFEVPTGVVADTYSRRFSVILGTFILGAGFIVTGLARSFEIILLAQVICGLGYTFLSGATDAWLADEVGETNVGGVYLRAGQIRRITGIIGIGINAALASVMVFLPILTGGILYVLLAVFLLMFMPETTLKPVKKEEGEKGGIGAMVTTFKEGARVVRGRPILWMLVAVNFFIGAASEGYDRLGDAHLVANFTFPSLGSLQPVVWFSILALAGSLFSLATTEILRRRMEKVSQNHHATARVLLGLNLASAALVTGFALAQSFPLAVACLMAHGAVSAFLYPLYNAWVVQNTSSRVRATVLSMTSQSNALGQVAGGPGVGWIGTHFSLRAALVTAGLLLLPISGLYARAIKNGHTAQEESAALDPGAFLDPEAD